LPLQPRSRPRYTVGSAVQYSVRTRRRLRPATRDLLPLQSKSTPAPAPVLAEGTGVTRTTLLDRPVIDRVAPRAKRDSWQR
jgi:hypothetical protein